MSDVALWMNGVGKRFRRGENHNSLRDLIPALVRRKPRRKPEERDFWALKGVTFEVKKGEAFGIIGHNGAGKSTMLKLLSRIMRPTEGEFVVNGRLSALIEVSAGFHQDLTGRENIYLNGTILGMSRQEIDAKLDAIIDFSGLEDFIDTPVKRYSSGMFARLGFSVAAHVDPEVLIIDEVLSVGDFVFQQKCVRRMTEVIRNGTTVLFVSHNLHAVAELCQRSLLLDHGKVVAIDESNRIIARYMDGIRARHVADATKEASLLRVSVKRGEDEEVRFTSGERVHVDVEVGATRQCRRLAVVVWLRDDSHYIIFDTSSERLGHDPWNLEAGDTLRCRFELQLAMAYGTYNVCVALHRYETDTTIDSWEPAATIFVGPRIEGFKGVVNCQPSLTFQSVDAAAATR